MIQRGLIRRSVNSGARRHTRHGITTKGCLIAVAVFLTLLLVVGGLSAYFVAKNWRGWAGSGFEAMMVSAVDNSNIEDSEKVEVKAIIADVRADFVSGAISFEDFTKIAEGFESSPLIPATVASESYRQYYDKNPDLTDEDKAAAKLQLGRLARGIFEESISNSEMVAVLDPITAPAGSTGSGVQFDMNGVEVSLKEPAACSIEELRQVTANAGEACDAAGVPGEAFEVDISDELQKIVNKALGRDTAAGGDEKLNTAPPVTPEGEASETYDEAVGDAPGAEPTDDDGP